MIGPQKQAPNPEIYRVKTFGLRISPTNEIRLTGAADLGPYRIPWKTDDLNARTLLALVDMLRDNRIKATETELMGEYLYQILLQNPIGEHLYEQWVSNPDLFLRIELIFEDWSGELTGLPWEYLYHRRRDRRGYFLAREERIALVRRPRIEHCRVLPVKGAGADRKLKVLLIACSPSDLPRLEFDSLVKSIQSLEDLKVTTLVTPYTDSPAFAVAEWGPAQATYENFVNALKDEPHVVHFLGHGENRDGGRLAFVNEGYQKQWKSGAELAKVFEKFKSVRLTFLQACETAAASDSVAMYRALSSVAEDLVQTGIPAIVAMQSRVENAQANTFASTFYRSVVRLRQPIYRAMQLARTASSEPESACIPVLYLVQDENGENEPGILFPDPETPAGLPPGVLPPDKGAPPANAIQISCPWCKRIQQLTEQIELTECTICASPLKCKCGKKFVTAIADDQDRYRCPFCREWSYRYGGPETPTQDGFGGEAARRQGMRAVAGGAHPQPYLVTEAGRG